MQVGWFGYFKADAWCILQQLNGLHEMLSGTIPRDDDSVVKTVGGRSFVIKHANGVKTVNDVSIKEIISVGGNEVLQKHGINQGHKVRRDTLKLIFLIYGSTKANMKVNG